MSESTSEEESDSFSDSSSDSEDWDLNLSSLQKKVTRGQKGKKGDYTPSIGDIVEVYWVGEGEWFEGEVTDVEGSLFAVSYKDGHDLRHDYSCTRVRLKE